VTAINRTDIAIVGAGIVGLAHAIAAAKKGLRVTVFDRNLKVVGASIRNFGMLWPIGQPDGKLLQRALRSREIWLEIAPQAGIAIEKSGSLHLAYRQDELAVLEEFVSSRSPSDSLKILSAAEVATKSPAAITDGLLGALWSETETIIDPRQAMWNLPNFLASNYGIQFQFSKVVTAINHPDFLAGGDRWQAERILVCSGSDFETLYPQVYAELPITKSKLQMMRTAPQPNGWRLGASLCGGLTLTHYQAFAHCQSLAALKARIAEETPHFPQWHIHVMVSQNATGELTIGDSHEYGLNPEPFDREDINTYILDYLHKLARFPAPAIVERWNGVYPKLPGKTELIVHPEPGVTIINALGGNGMTLSFGLAEEAIASL
jgi:D-hydroxyproline dehydrogenase subunit beta